MLTALIGAALPDALRESDVVGRHGGEEFIVLLPDTNRAGALLVAEKLRETLAALTISGVERGDAGHGRDGRRPR
jgi:diguanylate cyclase (GGDEF)-like protein